MEKTVEQLSKLLNDHETRITKLEEMIYGQPEEQIKGKKKLSVKEFLRLKKPNNDVQKTLAIGYYLEKNEKMPSFNVDDLHKAFKDAKEPKPSNVHAFVNQNIINGNIMDYGEKKEKKKAFVLTGSGERFVENNFGKKDES